MVATYRGIRKITVRVLSLLYLRSLASLTPCLQRLPHFYLPLSMASEGVTCSTWAGKCHLDQRFGAAQRGARAATVYSLRWSEIHIAHLSMCACPINRCPFSTSTYHKWGNTSFIYARVLRRYLLRRWYFLDHI